MEKFVRFTLISFPVHKSGVLDFKQVDFNCQGRYFPGGILPYMDYIGMCGPKGYGFSAVLVINRVSIIAILPPLWS